MSDFDAALGDPQMADAIDAIQQTVLESYPGTTFTLQPGEDPGVVWMWGTVDVDDTDEVFNLVLGHLLEFQLENRIPLHFYPIRTLDRTLADLGRERTGSDQPLAATGTGP